MATTTWGATSGSLATHCAWGGKLEQMLPVMLRLRPANNESVIARSLRRGDPEMEAVQARDCPTSLTKTEKAKQVGLFWRHRKPIVRFATTVWRLTAAQLPQASLCKTFLRNVVNPQKFSVHCHQECAQFGF
jgi:hypothetical protein